MWLNCEFDFFSREIASKIEEETSMGGYFAFGLEQLALLFVIVCVGIVLAAGALSLETTMICR